MFVVIRSGLFFFCQFGFQKYEGHSNRTDILRVLYGYEAWCLILREEHRLKVFENRVLRKIFGPKRDGVTGEWRKLHSEELLNVYYSPHIIRVTKSIRRGWARGVTRMGDRKCLYRFLLGRPEGRKPFGRPKHRWEDNIKMDLRELGWGGWIQFFWLMTEIGGERLVIW